MEFVGKGREQAGHTTEDEELYRVLAVGDLPAAWLLTKAVMEKSKTEQLPYTTAFNCGLCLYRLEEYEKALAELKRAEQSLGNPPDLDISEKKPFMQALSVTGEAAALLPLAPGSGKRLERYGFLRVKWLMTLSLLRLGRQQEAAAGIRFLRQYHIELQGKQDAIS
ncbi:hypothetical protein V1224_04545 [Lachnospiraceae bacterium JLR.KK008]